VLTTVTSVSEVIVIFLQLILFANTAVINHLRDSWLVLRNDDVQTGFPYL